MYICTTVFLFNILCTGVAFQLEAPAGMYSTFDTLSFANARQPSGVQTAILEDNASGAASFEVAPLGTWG